ncbi:MAG: TetR/AcrR family transcriptional regulator [Bacteroidia bacterium]|nr:TetR/AcrR family transcriptional regulator [Bacteroidia bacterium]
MKKTPEKILDTAHQLFNEEGVAAVSLRQIAAGMKISHGNLIYHFKSKQEIIERLHGRILQAALEENQKLKDRQMSIWTLIQMARSGFKTLYDYRFFMIDLNLIMRENEKLKKEFLEIEKLRAHMYREAISDAIEEGIMREKEYAGEYEQFIKRIRIFSDCWISSAEIYNSEGVEQIIEEHVQLFMNMFYPYLTEKGKSAYKENL